MDYILFYSNYSPSSLKILQEFPQIMTKSVSVDSLQIRDYVKKINIMSVPTLVVLLNTKIVDRVIGHEDISTWLTQMVYQASRIQQNESEEFVENIEEERNTINKTDDSQEPLPSVTNDEEDDYSMEAIGPPAKVTQGIASVVQHNISENGKTDLSSLTLIDDDDPASNISGKKTEDPNGTMQTAEQMKRQRQMDENDFSSNKPKLPNTLIPN